MIRFWKGKVRKVAKILSKESIKTPVKYYFSDLGLRNARINFRQFE